MEFSSPKIKKILIFSQEGFPFILGNGTIFKNFLYFKSELSELAR